MQHHPDLRNNKNAGGCCKPLHSSSLVKSNNTAATAVVTKSQRFVSPRPTKTVHFRAFVQVHLVAKEQDEMLWYQDNEIQSIRSSLAETALAIEIGRYEGDDDQQSARGLENQTQKGSQRKRRRKRAGRLTVLKEQSRQWSTGIRDDEALRNAYLKISLPCLQEAHAWGRMDEREALAIHSSQKNENSGTAPNSSMLQQPRRSSRRRRSSTLRYNPAVGR